VSAELNGKTMAEIGRLRGVSPYDALFDLLIEEGERVQALVWIFELIDQKHLDQLLRRDDCALESDGLGGIYPLHPRCFGWTARLLGEHVRERGILSLEAAVRRITGLPAERLQLRDRGTLAEGAGADIVVFDAGRIRDCATYETPDRAPEGIRWAIVNGEVALSDGEVVSASSGRLLRKR
jgi:N-acyl-D-aspartate/D-glutamate deacylase